MNEESILHAPLTPAISTTQLVAEGSPQEAPQNPAIHPVVSLIATGKDETPIITIENKLHEMSELAPEKASLPGIGHKSRQKAIAKYLWCAFVSALDRAFVLLIVLAILTALKHVVCECGLMAR